MNTKRRFITLVTVLYIGLFCSACRKEVAVVDLMIPRLHLEGRVMNYGSMTTQRMIMPKSKTTIEVIKQPLISEFDIMNAEMVKVDLGMALLLQLSEQGARNLYRASVVNKGNRIVVTINGNPVGFRRIDGPIMDGNLFCFIEMNTSAMEELVLSLKKTAKYLQTYSKQSR
ncbi:MAG: Uncharacterised protein [Opitutia bacterium UBA7350]|nr:MAG: Uncharacterised protein [Opitutae bacterium UBA7350]